MGQGTTYFRGHLLHDSAGWSYSENKSGVFVKTYLPLMFDCASYQPWCNGIVLLGKVVCTEPCKRKINLVKLSGWGLKGVGGIHLRSLWCQNFIWRCALKYQIISWYLIKAHLWPCESMRHTLASCIASCISLVIVVDVAVVKSMHDPNCHLQWLWI